MNVQACGNLGGIKLCMYISRMCVFHQTHTNYLSHSHTHRRSCLRCFRSYLQYKRLGETLNGSINLYSISFTHFKQWSHFLNLKTKVYFNDSGSS